MLQENRQCSYCNANYSNGFQAAIRAHQVDRITPFAPTSWGWIKTNQAFSCIPHYLLLQKIQYKAAAVGIEVLFTEEAYTSKASFYDRDPLPKFGEEPPKFSGTRKHRGLYITKDNFALNADVNASMNIGRKVIPEFEGIRDRSLAARPVAVNPLHQKYSTVKVV